MEIGRTPSVTDLTVKFDRTFVVEDLSLVVE